MSTTYGNNTITPSGTLNINGNVCINPDHSNTIIGIQMGTSTSSGTECIVNFANNGFPTNNIVVQLTPNYVDAVYLINPQLKNVTANYFTWEPVFYYYSSGVRNDGQYTIYWTAICYG